MPASTSGIAGHALLPGREPLRVVEPAVAAGAHVVDLGPRPREQDLRVEVAPAELPHEGVAAAAPGRARRGRAPRRSRSAGRARGARSRRRRSRRGRPCRSRRAASAARRPPARRPRSRRRPSQLVLNQHKVRRSAPGVDAVGQPDRARRRGRASPTAPVTRRGGRARRPDSGRCPSAPPRRRERRSCRRRGGGRPRPRAASGARPRTG